MRKARESIRLSQLEIAKLIGVKRTTVSNYEVGKTPPKRPILLSWALACQVDLDWLRTGVPAGNSPDRRIDFNSDCRKSAAQLERIRRIAPNAPTRWAERAA